jgi:hypothetical protein
MRVTIRRNRQIDDGIFQATRDPKQPLVAQQIVKPPLFTVEETIGRTVGQRTKTPDGLSTATRHKAESIAWTKSFGGVRVPRVVYRFKTSAHRCLNLLEGGRH